MLKKLQELKDMLAIQIWRDMIQSASENKYKNDEEFMEVYHLTKEHPEAINSIFVMGLHFEEKMMEEVKRHENAIKEIEDDDNNIDTLLSEAGLK